MQGKIRLYNHWGFLECDHTIGKYYRSLFLRTFGIKLERPSNDEHITIISPQDNLLLSDLHAYNGLTLDFTTLSTVWTNGQAYWLDVVSDDIEKFRLNLGLSRHTYLGLHFCIGYK